VDLELHEGSIISISDVHVGEKEQVPWFLGSSILNCKALTWVLPSSLLAYTVLTCLLDYDHISNIGQLRLPFLVKLIIMQEEAS
jgi:hypothetical protein